MGLVHYSLDNNKQMCRTRNLRPKADSDARAEPASSRSKAMRSVCRGIKYLINGGNLSSLLNPQGRPSPCFSLLYLS